MELLLCAVCFFFFFSIYRCFGVFGFVFFKGVTLQVDLTIIII